MARGQGRGGPGVQAGRGLGRSKERLLPLKFRLGTAHGAGGHLSSANSSRCPLRGTIWARPKT